MSAVMLDRPKLWDVEHMVELLGQPPYRIYDMVRLGQLPAVRIGRRIRFDPRAIERWIEAGGTQPSRDAGEAA